MFVYHVQCEHTFSIMCSPHRHYSICERFQSVPNRTLCFRKSKFFWVGKIELFALVRLFKIRNIFERPIYLTLISRFLYINKITMV